MSIKWESDVQLKDAMAQLLPILEKYRDHENVEIEFRLGLYDDTSSKFNSRVCEKDYNRIMEKLKSSTSWSEVKNSDTKDYFDNGMRLSVDNKNKRKKKCIRKSKLVTLDFQFDGTPYDIRVCLSEEVPVPTTKFKVNDSLFSRVKERCSFVYKFWSFDVTRVNFENSVEDVYYEVELDAFGLKELMKKHSSEYILYSGLLKIKDLVNVCEKVEPDCRLEHLDTREYS